MADFPLNLADILRLSTRAARRTAAKQASPEVQRQYQAVEYATRRGRFPQGTPLSVVRGHGGAEQAELLGFQLPIKGIRAERHLGKIGSAVAWRTAYPQHVITVERSALAMWWTSWK